MTAVERVFVGLGANLGDAAASVRAALGQLRQLPDTTLVAVSSLYRSAPLDATGPDYINAVAELRTELTPQSLFAQLVALEQRFGRQRPFHHAPRSLDLDLLLFGERTVATAHLQVPHPRMYLRAFVLAPLAELAPGLICHGGLNAVQILATLADQPIERLGAHDGDH